jgi:hypothetical protein
MGATFIFTYGRSRHEIKKGDRKAAADVLRYARANRPACQVERICQGQFLIDHPARHTKVRINVR